MARDKKSMIGFDPLSWLDDEAEHKAVKDTKKKSVKSKATKEASDKKTKKPVKVIIEILGHSLDETALLKGYELMSEVLDEVVIDFYAELFKQYPAVQPLFENTSDKEQAIKLSTALKLLVNNLQDENALKSTLLAMGERHQAYGALPDHYPIVAELLVASFKNKIGRAWTKAIGNAWMEFLIASAETMCAAYQEQPNEVSLEAQPMADISQVDRADEAKQEENTLEEIMPIEEIINDSSHPVLILNSVQDISKSQALKNDMLTLVNDNDEIDIDASGVERIDGSALQLLCALFNYAKQNNLTINWLNPSEVLTQSAKTLGVLEILELN